MPDAIPLLRRRRRRPAPRSPRRQHAVAVGHEDTLQHTVIGAREAARRALPGSQVVAGQQEVDVRRGDHHSERARAEVGIVALVGVHPDDAMAQPRQSFHRVREHGRIATVEAVGADHDDRAAARPRRPQPLHERVERIADAGAALPVEDALGRGRRARRRVGGVRAPGDARQTGAEAEHLDPWRGATSRVARTAGGCASSRPSIPIRRGSARAAASAGGAAARTARTAHRACASSRGPSGGGLGGARTARSSSAGCDAEAAPAGCGR